MTWQGEVEVMKEVLAANGADNVDGVFEIGPGPEAFWWAVSGKVIVVTDAAEYYVNGEPRPLSPLLHDCAEEMLDVPGAQEPAERLVEVRGLTLEDVEAAQRALDERQTRG